MKVCLYTLTDPTNGEVRYVGKTIQSLKARLTSHISKAKNEGKKSYVYCWIRCLLNQGLQPIIELVDIVDENHWEEDERFYISYFQFLGFRLTNSTEGGDKGTIGARWKLSEETKFKNKDKNNKPISQYNIEGKLIKEWGSSKEFAQYYNVHNSVPSNLIKTNRIWNNFVLIPYGESFSYKLTSYGNPILLLNNSTKIIKEFESAKSLADFLNIDNSTVSKALKKGTVLLKQYKVEYKYENLS